MSMSGSLAKLGVRVLTIAALVVVVVVANRVRGNEPGVTFAGCCNGIDLKVDSSAFYNGSAMPNLSWTLKNLVPHVDKFFNFADIKPGDYGRTVISLHVNKNAWMCLDFTKLKDEDNTQNEPEALVDPDGLLSGELAEGMEFFGWFDDGDTFFEVGETPLFGTSTQSASTTINYMSYALADAGYGTPFVASTTRYVGIAWCAGDMQVNLGTAQIGCDGTALGNAAQTDSLKVSISLRAVPTKDASRFTCVRRRPPNDNECSIYDDPNHTGEDRPDDDDRDDDRTRSRTSTSTSSTTTTSTSGGGSLNTQTTIRTRSR